MKHCLICDNKIEGVNNQFICAKTNKLPYYDVTCESIVLNQNLREKIVVVNRRFIEVKDEEKGNRRTFMILFVLGLLALILSLIYFDIISEYEYSEMLMFFRMIQVFGFILVTVSLTFLSPFKRKMDKAKQDKEGLDNILSYYGISYNITFDKQLNKNISIKKIPFKLAINKSNDPNSSNNIFVNS